MEFKRIEFLKDVIINGDLTVQGTSYTESAEQILTKGALTVLNAENNDLDLTLMGTVIRTGKKDDNDNYVDYAIIYDPLNEAVRLGVGTYAADTNTFAFKEGDGKPVATRDFSEDDDGYLTMWDADNYCFVKSTLRVGESASSIATADSTAISEGAVALGTGNTAGSHAFDIVRADAVNKTFALSSIEGLEAGMTCYYQIGNEPVRTGTLGSVYTSEATETTSYTLSGVWKWNCLPKRISKNINRTENINFTCNGTQYRSIEVYAHASNESTSTMLAYYDNLGNFQPCFSYTAPEAWGDTVGTLGESLRTVDFGLEPQTVSADFYEYFTNNVCPVITVSGKWAWNDELPPSDFPYEAVNFTAPSYNGNGELEQRQHYGIDLWVNNSHDYYLYYYSSTSIESGNTYWVSGGTGWVMAPPEANPNVIDFGAEPQPVSLRFYQYLTTNAVPQEQQTVITGGLISGNLVTLDTIPDCSINGDTLCRLWIPGRADLGDYTIGECAFVEGKATTAIGDYSHAGGLGTKAVAEAQTVIGKYNIEDRNALFIVGSGINNASRNNALTVHADGVTQATSFRASNDYGQTWIFNENLINGPFDPFYGTPDFKLDFICEGTVYSRFCIRFDSPEHDSNPGNYIPHIAYDYIDVYNYTSNDEHVYCGEWLDPTFRTITILGGEDASNESFLQWLQANAVQTNASTQITAGKINLTGDGTSITINGKKVLTEAYSAGLAYTLNEDSESYGVSGIGECKDTDIIIPSTYNGKHVTRIGDHAFMNNSTITSVVIPDSVTEIGASAFSYCTALSSITIGTGVTTIGAHAFTCPGLTELYFNATAVSQTGAWDGLQYEGAFANAGIDCDGITVYIGANVRSIPAQLFYQRDTWHPQLFYYPSIIRVVFAENSSCTTIGAEAFHSNTDSIIIIPKSVTTIGSCGIGVGSASTIYCEAEQKPEGWDQKWTYQSTPVVWGYITDFEGVNNKFAEVNDRFSGDLEVRSLYTEGSVVASGVYVQGKKALVEGEALPVIISTTYAKLKQLRDDSELIPGAFYRITDYECTTAQANTRAMNNKFDIIVQALATGTLSENASADYHYDENGDVDGYFQLNETQTKQRPNIEWMFSLGAGGYDGMDLTIGDFGYEENNNGITVPVMYANILNEETGESSINHDDKWFYIDEHEFNDEVYSRWRLIEAGTAEEGCHTWNSGDKKFILTNSIVQNNQFTIEDVVDVEIIFTMYDDNEGSYAGPKSSDVIVEATYAENDKGVLVPVLYKTDIESFADEVDYGDPMYYVGRYEYKGETYDRWRKVELENSDPWNTTTRYYILTNIVVEDNKFMDGVVEEIIKGDIKKVASIPAWELKYCLDNDTDRFAWAVEGEGQSITETFGYSFDSPLIRQPKFDGQEPDDSEYQFAWGTQSMVDEAENNDDPALLIYSLTDKVSVGDELYFGSEILHVQKVIGSAGKGVIYYMKDEWNNECHYDFKNIQFQRSAEWQEEHSDFITDLRLAVDDLEWFYTFSYINMENLTAEDLTLKQDLLSDEEGVKYGTHDNSMLPYVQDAISIPRIALNNNVMIYCPEADPCFYGCYDNSFKNNCHDNTFGNNCYSNTFGNKCYSNTFGNECYSNTFGDYCYSNIFGNKCYSTIFKDYCYSNTFGKYCDYNTFGSHCNYNTFGDYCDSNIFESGCDSNIFGSSKNNPISYVQNVHFANDCKYINLLNSETGSYQNCVQNITVSAGISGATDSPLELQVSRNAAPVVYEAAGTTHIILD